MDSPVEEIMHGRKKILEKGRCFLNSGGAMEIICSFFFMQCTLKSENK